MMTIEEVTAEIGRILVALGASESGEKAARQEAAREAIRPRQEGQKGYQ